MIAVHCDESWWRRIARILRDARHCPDWKEFCDAALVSDIAVWVLPQALADETRTIDLGNAPLCQLIVVTQLDAMHVNFLAGELQPLYVDIDRLDSDPAPTVARALTIGLHARFAAQLTDEHSAPETRLAVARLLAAAARPASREELAGEAHCAPRHLEYCLLSDLGLSFDKLRRLALLCHALELKTRGHNIIEIEVLLDVSRSTLDRSARFFLGRSFHQAARIGICTVLARILERVREHQSSRDRPRHRKL